MTNSIEPNESLDGPIVSYNVLRHPNQVLVKRVEILPDNTISKNPGGQIPIGSTISSERKPLSQYIQEAFNGGVSQYIHPSNVDLGTNIPISSKQFVTEGGVDRTASTLFYVEGPATLTLDHDPSFYSNTPVSGPIELFEILNTNFPAVFKLAAWGAYDSSSSFIYDNNGIELTGRRGFHMVFAVEYATDIPQFGDLLFKHLWLKGFGYIHVSKDGKALPRTIFDTKVLEPQQPLFAGGAHCINCEQRRPDPIWNAGYYLKTSGLSALTESEGRKYQQMIQEAKIAAKPKCDNNKLQYMKQSEADLVKKTGISNTHAKQVIEARMGGTLLGADVLMFDEHGEVTVANVLANLELYNGATLADPIEGGIAGKAIFYMNSDSGNPIIFSHAHGGNNFFLQYDLFTLISILKEMSAEDACKQWSNNLVKSKLQEDELDQYLVAVKKKTGIGIGALRGTVKKLMKDVDSYATNNLKQDPGIFLAHSLLDQDYEGGNTLIKLESGNFWHYTSTHWTEIKDSVLNNKLQKIASNRWEHFLAMWDASGKKSSTLSSLVSSALACLGNIVFRSGDPLRLNSIRPSVINCINGELHLLDDNAELRPHSPESYLTSCSLIAYDPLAKAPTFDVGMRGILSFPGGTPMPDQDEMLRHVEELLGYTIQTRRNLKVFILIVGPGDNGKTTFIKILSKILGLDAIAFDRLGGVSEDGNRFATSRLVGKLVLIDDDIDAEYLLPDGLLKKIAEEKPLTAEIKFKESFTFTAQVVPILLGNSWPRLRDLSRGMQTRANVLYLPRRFLKPSECDANNPDLQNPEIWDKVFKDEMSGVLNRLVAGYYRVAQRKGFLPPESAKRAFDMWLMESNVVARFIEDACVKIESTKPGCTTSEAYNAFIKWCEANGVQSRHRPQLNQLKKKLEDIGIRVAHTDHGTGVFGFKINSVWSDHNSSPFKDNPEFVNVAKAQISLVT